VVRWGYVAHEQIDQASVTATVYGPVPAPKEAAIDQHVPKAQGSSAMAVQAALDAVGVLVAQLPYVGDALASGRLVAPFGISRQPGSTASHGLPTGPAARLRDCA